MSPRSEPGLRPVDEALSGAPAAGRFVLTLLAELAIAAVLAVIVLHYASRETIDVMAALGIAVPIVIGGSSIVWLELSCHWRAGYSPVGLLLEIAL
ncbi:hypothetical protein [Sphingomonas sp. NPDC079357]|uniref:hypothetical protein n=1 Tax=Sphingomonas sp. NPDC079357 TaxID=3364518 RepID=UPI00384E3C27